MELCFEKQEDQDMRYQWSNCHCLDIKTSFQGLPKFNLKPAMVERNPILLTNLIPFERSLLPQGFLYLEWDPKIFLQIFPFWRKGMAIAQDNPSCLVKRRHIRSVIMGSTMYNSNIIHICQMKKVIHMFVKSLCLNCRRTKWMIMTHQLLTRYFFLKTSVLLPV